MEQVDEFRNSPLKTRTTTPPGSSFHFAPPMNFASNYVLVKAADEQELFDEGPFDSLPFQTHAS